MASNACKEYIPGTHFSEGTSSVENLQMYGNVRNARKRALINRNCSKVAHAASWHGLIANSKFNYGIKKTFLITFLRFWKYILTS